MTDAGTCQRLSMRLARNRCETIGGPWWHPLMIRLWAGINRVVKKWESSVVERTVGITGGTNIKIKVGNTVQLATHCCQLSKLRLSTVKFFCCQLSKMLLSTVIHLNFPALSVDQNQHRISTRAERQYWHFEVV